MNRYSTPIGIHDQKVLTYRLLFLWTGFWITQYCWFSHDVTKIQTKKLSILPRFYFHDGLEQLKANLPTNVCFKRVLGFVIEYGQENCHVD